ncbi:MAG: right-handed parallel beta-helix repeat-containing protein [Candidatus Sumerlaeia bacterium]|nr:right-handed parallel beta-helix repeat-containing protein [Candidatus Sumerlaeia bacterium]
MRTISSKAMLATASMLAMGLLASAAHAQTTWTVGSETGTDFPDIETAIADATVVDGDTLLLDPANNGGNDFIRPNQHNVDKAVRFLGNDDPVVTGGQNWFFTADGEVILEGLILDGGNNAIVVNDPDTTVTVNNTIIRNFGNRGINMNAGTANVINGSEIIDGGAFGFYVLGAGNNTTILNIEGTETTPIVISGMPQGIRTGVFRDTGDSATVSINLEHVAISGVDIGIATENWNNGDNNILFENVDISGFTLNAIRVDAQEVSVTYNGGTTTGRTAEGSELEESLVHFALGSGNSTFTASDLIFPAGNYGSRIRNDSTEVMSISSSHISTGLFPTNSFGFVGTGGVEFTDTTFDGTSGMALIQSVGGDAPITLIDPEFIDAGWYPFYLIGHAGVFTIEGTDPLNKVDLDTANMIPDPAVFVTKNEGEVVFRNVTSTTNSKLFQPTAGPLNASMTITIEASIFGGRGGHVRFEEINENSPDYSITINASNSIWTGNYEPFAYTIGSITAAAEVAEGSINLSHSIIAPSVTNGWLMLTDGINTVNSEYSIFDARGTKEGAGTDELGVNVPMTGQGNITYSEEFNLSTGGFFAGVPSDTIVANPFLDSNGIPTAASPAIDAAVDSTETTDIFGTSRPQRAVADIGAVESFYPSVEIDGSGLPAATNQTVFENVPVTFSEDVSGLDVGDFVTDGITVSNLQGSGSSYTIDLELTGGEGTKTVQLAAAVATTDVGNHDNQSSNQIAIVLDTTPPAVTGVSGIPGLVPGVSPGLTNQSNLTGVEITFSEDVTGLTSGGFDTDGATVSNVSGSGANWSFDIELTGGDGSKSMTLLAGAVSDAAGNENAALGPVPIILDQTPPVTTITTDDLSATDTVVLEFSASDANGVASTALYVQGPSDSSLVDSGLAPVGNTFVYTATEAGVHQFAAVSTDNAGNVESPGAGNSATVVINTTENGPLTLHVAEGIDVEVNFPLTDDYGVTITFDEVLTSGTVTVTRVEGDGNAVSLGLDPDSLAGQYFIITADSTLDFTTATIVFDLDPALLGSNLGSLTDIVIVLVNRSGTVTAMSGGDVSVDAGAGTVTVSGVVAFSEWYFGDTTTSVSDWMILMD